MSSTIIETLKDVRKRIETIPNEQYRNAFKYQYLIGGDAGEVSGINAPLSSDAQFIQLRVGSSEIDAILFIVKTVRRQDHFRACVLPLDTRFDPWVKDVYNWIQKNEDTYPFRFPRKDGSGVLGAKTSKTYIMNLAKEIFQGLTWFKEGYTTTKKRQERRDVDFTSSQLRDLRLAVLSELYAFDEADSAYFGAWKLKSYNERVNAEVEEILSKKFSKDDVADFYKIGERYLYKLLIPFEDSTKLIRRIDVDTAKIRSRFLMISQIILLIQKINIWSEAKLNASIFKENMMITYDIMNDCEDEYQFNTKITNLERLFDVKLGPLRKLVSDPPENIGSIILFNMWLDQNNVEYDKNMINTWLNINNLRNNLLHTMNPRKYMEILNYFNVEFKDPIKYNKLWDNIIIRFKESLDELFRILNGCRVFV